MKFKNIVSEIIWDKGNLNALKSYIDDDPKEKYKIIVHEPFEFETTDSTSYYSLRQLLYDADANFDASIEKI